MRVRIGDDDRWWLEVENHSDQGVAGIAYHFWKDGFLAEGPDRWTSPIFEAREKHAVPTWNGDAATMLAGVNGHLISPTSRPAVRCSLLFYICALDCLSEGRPRGSPSSRA